MTEVNPTDCYNVGYQMLEKAISRAAGTHQEYCWGRPERQYYIANLAPGADTEQRDDDDGPFSQVRPSMVGIRFRPASIQQELSLEISFAVYLRVLPTADRLDNENGLIDVEDIKEPYSKRVEIDCSLELDLTESTEALSDQIETTVERSLTDELDTAEQDSTLIPDGNIGDVPTLRGEDYIRLEEMEQLHQEVKSQSSLDQTWDVGATVTFEDTDTSASSGTEVTIELFNNSTDSGSDWCSFLFNQKITVSGQFKRYRFRSIPEDFRYDRNLWAKGLNASTTIDLDDPETEETSGTVATDQTPHHQTYRFQHRSYENNDNPNTQDYSNIELLAGEGSLDLLRGIAEDMQQYLTAARSDDERREELTQDLNEDERIQFDRSLNRFESEIANFRAGIEVIADHPDALKAFKLANETFDNDESVEFNSWRPFQIVFIVSNIPSIVQRIDDDLSVDSRLQQAEVLSFPTGSGKTEAYLGLILFNLFFDRIRGKNKGVTAWIRFPLTLLGEQQMSRFLKKLVEANKVKADHELPGSEFDLGYFVGSRNTPNQIEDPGGYANEFHEEFQYDKELLRKECRVIQKCPECRRQNVDVEFHSHENRVDHICTNENCDLDRLPLYVTDYEIYRYVPSVLLGTLDKIAVTGLNPRFANLIGNLTTECKVHGYGYSGKCSESNTIDCDATLQEVEEPFADPIPTLHLVDEVHLLNEELGVFASHYESMYLELCRKSGGTVPKIITSTATISDKEGVTDSPAYERLMRGLFTKDANRFPEEGPSITESYYGRIQVDDDDQQLRRFYGITPNNKTHIYAVLDLVKQYQSVIRDVRRGMDDEGPSILDVDITDDELHKILILYELSIIYFLKKTEKDRFQRSIRSQINRELRDDGYEPDEELKINELTGDADTDGLLEEIEDRASKAFPERYDIITATNFISHGIDVDPFNSMFFFGFPRRTFEYIQSSSRVGREHPGFVVDIFQPMDKRDRHRFKYFGKTHEYLDRTVEETSIARWSRFSLDKTFPGLFQAILLQYYRPLMHREYDVNVQSSRQLQDVLYNEHAYPEFTKDEFQTILERAYGVISIDANQEQEYFKREVSEKLELAWEYWVDHLDEEFYTTFRNDPMRSLRDIGESIEIRVDSDQRKAFDALTGGDD